MLLSFEIQTVLMKSFIRVPHLDHFLCPILIEAIKAIRECSPNLKQAIIIKYCVGCSTNSPKVYPSFILVLVMPISILFLNHQHLNTALPRRKTLSYCMKPLLCSIFFALSPLILSITAIKFS